MIDLTQRGLPNVVMIGGKPYSIYTDFRVWLRFEIAVSHMSKGEQIEIGYLFKNDRPAYCDIVELFAFSRPQSVLPRQVGRSNDAILFDFELDADLIYAAFLGQYGIDLTEIEDLHWHKFLALFGGLNNSTKMREVMGYRAYQKETRKRVDEYEELREAWAIEPPMTEEEKEELEAFSNAFDRKGG